MSDANPPTQPPAGDPLRPTAEQKRVQETVMLDKQGLADLTAQAKAGAAQAPATPSTPDPAAAPAAPAATPAAASSGGANTKLIGLVIGLVALLVVVVIVGLALKG